MCIRDRINDTYQDGEDISWLWDVDFQYLADAQAATITTTGTRRHDMGLRLKYEDIPCDSTTNLRATVQERTENGTGREGRICLTRQILMPPAPGLTSSFASSIRQRV